MNIRIATRPSKLALEQAKQVANIIKKKHPEITPIIKEFSTKADRNPGEPISNFGGKGIFTKEIEAALLNNQADIAVHSVKDLPSTMADVFSLPAILKRATVNDVLISKNNKTLLELPPNAVVGTSSLRRKLQLQAIRPDLDYQPIRGNIDTRIKNNKYDAIILAYAGLERLELTDYITEVFSINDILPQAGQGAIGVQCLTKNNELNNILEHITDTSTAVCINTERQLMAKLGGHCQAPIAALATQKDNTITLTAKVFGKNENDNITCIERCNLEQIENIGTLAANTLNAMGAQNLINKLKEGI